MAKIYSTAVIAPETVLELDESAVIGDQVFISVPKLVMGEGSQINAGARIVGREMCFIGKHVVVSYNAVIVTSSDSLSARMDDASPETEREIVNGQVILEDYSYVGSGAVVMPRTHLCEGGLIGALSYAPPETQVEAWQAGWGQPWKPRRSRPRKKEKRREKN